MTVIQQQGAAGYCARMRLNISVARTICCTPVVTERLSHHQVRSINTSGLCHCGRRSLSRRQSCPATKSRVRTARLPSPHSRQVLLPSLPINMLTIGLVNPSPPQHRYRYTPPSTSSLNTDTHPFQPPHTIQIDTQPLQPPHTIQIPIHDHQRPSSG